jgi:hypothetical protein
MSRVFGPGSLFFRQTRVYQDLLSHPTGGVKGRLIPSELSKSVPYSWRSTMGATYRYRVSIALPTSGAAISHREPMAVRRVKSTAASGLTGALAGTAGGAALAAGAAGFVPGVGLGVLIASGVLFGAFNGGLVGLLSRLEGR